MMEFGYDQVTRDLQERLMAFMDSHVYPAEPVFAAEQAARQGEWGPPPVVAQLQQAARARGLWNLFLPGSFGA
jgi:acyl-CoA dehydrogenase